MESNKAVEDVHQPIRLDAAANQKRKLSKDHIQDLIIYSGSFEARKVRHGAKVSCVFPARVCFNANKDEDSINASVYQAQVAKGMRQDDETGRETYGCLELVA